MVESPTVNAPAENAHPKRYLRAVSSQGVPASGVRLGSLPENSEEDLRFVQDRIALLGKVTFLISSMFLIVGSSLDLVGSTGRMLALGRASHVAGTLLALGLWRVAQSRRIFSPQTLQALDMAGTLGICLSFVTMGHYSVQPFGFYTGMLAVTHVSVSRAMIVPSVPSRTLVLAVASFAGFIVSRATLPIVPELAQVGGLRVRQLLEAALWSTAGSAIATVASKVIYGLQTKALEARQLGQYALEEKIGEGGMGAIYRARHAMLRRPTAVKLLSGDGSEHQLRRFEREVQLTARLTHPNTISIYDYGRTPDGVFYYAMELLDGLTLEELVERHGPQPPGRVIHILSQVCGALKEAHGIGLIHRDIKPANIYLCRRGDVADVVKVLDFGLVREMKTNGEFALTLTSSNVNTVVGTPLYLPPEAILNPEQIDGRADIYGLGGVAYFLVTGAAPFSGQTMIELCGHHLHTPPTPPSQRNRVPHDLERVILDCLAKDRATRPQSAQALSRALARCADAKGWSEQDADAWWTGAAAPNARPRTPPTRGTDQRQRTVCCVDLVTRLEDPKT